MLERILAIASAADFDFRAEAAPNDPLRGRFEEWVPYYRLKYAIAKLLEPRSILEVGVRYGYSAHAFLAAAPRARYLGLDNDSDSFGGSRGALAWARRTLARYDAEVRVCDTQALERFPGDRWDLVHIDGQQDGDGTFHDLRLALDCSEWILLDGFFWSRENMLSATLFLERYRDLIEGAYVLPGYAGELLIRVRASARRPAATGHEALRDCYTADYYLSDCGGYESFKAHAGRRLGDARLLVMHELGKPGPGIRVLDIGCGRGELAYAAWKAGADVVGLDYARDAVAIARRTYADALGERLDFVEGDVLDFEPESSFDLVYAGDVIEHLAPPALEAMFRKVSGWLRPGGRLVAHTWPNRLAYEARHRTQRAVAREAGLYLPPSPRTRYEELMHINEQTPARLTRSLRGAFGHVEIALAPSVNPAAWEAVRADRAQLRGLDSILAVAANESVPGFAELRQDPVPRDAAQAIRIDARIPATLPAGSMVEVEVTLTNGSRERLASWPPNPVNLSYHWLQNEETIVHDGVRTPLAPSLAADSRGNYAVAVQIPARPGEYTLELTLVQEGRFWFDSVASCAAAAARVMVTTEAHDEQ